MAEPYKIELARFTKNDADRPKKTEPIRKYPFNDLKPGNCFYVPAETTVGEHKRIRSAMWAYNKRTKEELLSRTMEDGRLCIYNPVEAILGKTEAEEIHPTQFEFVQWLATFEPGSVQTLDQERTAQPFTQLTQWIDEFVVKSGKHLTWEIEGRILSIECD